MICITGYGVIAEKPRVGDRNVALNKNWQALEQEGRLAVIICDLCNAPSQVAIIIFLPSVSIPEGGLKIDENDWKGMMLSPCSQGPTGRRVAEQHWNVITFY